MTTGVLVSWVGIVGAALPSLLIADDVQSLPVFLVALSLLSLVTAVVGRHDWGQAIDDGVAPRHAELWAVLLVAIVTVNVSLAIPRPGSWLYFLVISIFFALLLPGWRAVRVMALSLVGMVITGIASTTTTPDLATAAVGMVLVSLVGHATADMVSRVVFESQHRGHLLATVAQSARAVASLDLDVVPQRVGDAAMQLGFDMVAITERMGEEHRIVVERSRIGRVFGEDAMPIGPTVREAIESRSTVVRDHYLGRDDAQEDLRAHGIQSLVVSPVIVDGQTEALLVGGGRAPVLDRSQSEALTLLAGLLAQSLANARRYERERAAVATLDELGRLKDDFISNVSHELRTPITVILGGLQTLHRHRGELPDETRENLLRRALANGEALKTTLEALLEFAHVDRGQDQLGSDIVVDVVALVDEAVDRLSSLLEDHEVRLELPRAAPVRVASHQLDRVVDNLLVNVARHTPPGTTVDVRVVICDARVRVEVEDDGPGIPPEDLPRVTDRFFRGGEGNTRGTRGLGLGLTLAQTILESHGSRLEVTSRLGHGTRFAFELPLS